MIIHDLLLLLADGPESPYLLCCEILNIAHDLGLLGLP